MSSIRLGPCRARRLPCRLRTCRGRCRPLPGCLAFTPPRTEPDTIQIAPPKLNSTIEVRSRPDKQSPDERLPSPRGAEGATRCLPAVAEDGGSGERCPNQLVQDPIFTGTGRACSKEKSRKPEYGERKRKGATHFVAPGKRGWLVSPGLNMQGPSSAAASWLWISPLPRERQQLVLHDVLTDLAADLEAV